MRAKRMRLSHPEWITEFRPDDEVICPICGKDYLVVQIESDTNLLRVGCWNHWNEPYKVLRIEPLKSINGIPVTSFAESSISNRDERNYNGFGLEPGMPTV